MKFAAIWVNEAEEAGGFLPDNLENHTSDGKGKEKKKERGGRKEEKRRKQWLHSYWLLWTYFWAEKKKCLTEEVYLMV